MLLLMILLYLRYSIVFNAIEAMESFYTIESLYIFIKTSSIDDVNGEDVNQLVSFGFSAHQVGFK